MELMITIPINIATETLHKYLLMGVNTVRFNFSHNDLELFKNIYCYIKENFPNVKILQDLQGEKIRVNSQYIHDIKIDKGRKVCFCNEKYYKNNAYKVPYALLPINWEHDFQSLFLAEKITIGTTDIQKEKIIEDCAIVGTTLNDFVIRADKGINFVGIDRQNLSLTKKDLLDLEFVSKYPVDYICISFVESKKILQDVKEIVKHFDFKPKIIAKIETKNGCENIEEILTECDGIMLGRGDLSKEVNSLDFIKYQDKMIEVSKKFNKEIIVGTYAMCSMLYSEKPSVSDLTAMQYLKEKNIDCLMLSDEIVVGKNPEKTISLIHDMINIKKDY